MADARPCLLHPALAPNLDVVSKRWPELLGVLEHRLLDEVGDRVELDCDGLATKPRRLQWDGTAAGEHVEHLGGIPPLAARTRRRASAIAASLAPHWQSAVKYAAERASSGVSALRTSVAYTAARAAASGRRAHQRWSLRGWTAA